MTNFALQVEPRKANGSATARRLRKAGSVPTAIYSHGQKAILVSMVEREFVHLAQLARPSQVFSFKSADKDVDGKFGLVKEIQRDPLSGKVLHVDFLQLHAGEEVTVPIMLSFTGEAPGVKNDGGVLNINVHELHVRCLPEKIPSGSIIVDVSQLNIGDGIRARDLPLPEGVELTDDPDQPIVYVVVSRAAKLEEEAAEAAAAAAAAAGGEAPAEGAAAAPAAGAEKEEAE